MYAPEDRDALLKLFDPLQSFSPSCQNPLVVVRETPTKTLEKALTSQEWASQEWTNKPPIVANLLDIDDVPSTKHYTEKEVDSILTEKMVISQVYRGFSKEGRRTRIYGLVSWKRA